MATLYRLAPPAGFGAGTRVHALPFQRRISVPGVRVVSLPVSPTAQPLDAEATATPNKLPPADGVGLSTRFHPEPSQRAISVLGLALSNGPACPTAQVLRADAAATAKSVPPAAEDTRAIPGRAWDPGRCQ